MAEGQPVTAPAGSLSDDNVNGGAAKPQLLSDAEVMGTPSKGGSPAKLLSDADVMGTSQGKQVPDYIRPVVGANRAIASTLGSAVDAAASLMRPKTWESLSPDQQQDFAQRHPDVAKFMQTWSDSLKHPVGGSESVANAMGPASPNEVAPPTTPRQKILEAAGAGATSMALQGMGAEAVLAKADMEAGSFGDTLMNIIKGNGVASNAAMGAGAGVGAETASEAVPEPYKPAAELAGGVVGGGLVGGVTAAARAGWDAVKGAYGAITEEPELRAARVIAERAQDPEVLKAALAEANETPPLVEGSEPTTFQATGDLGVGGLEREVAASPTGVPAFAARREAQNTARLASVENLADADADPQAAGDFVKARLQEITDEHAGKVADAAHGVADTLAQAGGTAFDNPAAYGEALRTPLAALHQQTKDAASDLWRAIDPDLTAPVNVRPLKQAAEDLAGQIPEIAKQPTGEEASILDGIGKMGDTENFGSLVALRSRLTDAMRDERRNGAPTVLRRLSIMLDNVDDTLAGTASEIAANPAQRPGLLQRLQAESDAWQARQSATAGTGFGAGDRGLDAEPTTGVPAGAGSEGEADNGSGISAGNQGVPGNGLPPDVADRYAAARGATKNLKTTYEAGPVGSVLAPGAQYGSFKTTASNVAANLFDKPEAFQAFTEAAKDEPAALAPMQDYAAFSLRKAAVKDGMLSPDKYNAWIVNHGYVFDQFPDLATKFADIKTAQDTLDQSLVAQKAALTDYQNSAAKYFLKDQDPEQAVANAIKSPQAFGELVNSMRAEPAATAGLKRATVDYIKRQGLSTAESGTSGEPLINPASLQKVLLNNRGALSKLFSADEIKSMDNIVADLRQAGRSTNAVRIPGGSNTAQDTAGRASSMIQKLVQESAKGVGTIVGSIVGGPVGAGVGFVAGEGVSALKASRAKAVDSALTEMMLDPKMAAAWLAKVPAASADTTGQVFARQMRAVVANQLAIAIAQEAKKRTEVGE